MDSRAERARDRRLRAAAALTALVWLAACGPAPPGPPETGTPGPVETITGRERLGWGQQAAGPAELQTFGFALYVNGTRSVLTAFSCDQAPTPAGFPCSTPLPPLSPGPHVLELAAFIEVDGTVLESERSAPLRVNLVPAGSAAVEAPRQPLVADDGTPLRLELVASGLSHPTALAFDGGRVFVAERSGRVRLIEDGRIRIEPAITLEDAATGGEAGLLGMVLHPGFTQNRQVYLVFTAPNRDGDLSYRLARYREVGGGFGEPAVLLDDVRAGQRPAAAIRFGPDGKLYLALGGDDPHRAGDLADLGGKLLRLNDDGSTPDGNPWRSPVYAAPAGSPAAFDWQPGTGTLWLAGEDAAGAMLLAPIERGRPAARTAAPLDGRPQPAGAVFYGARTIDAFHGNLFIAAAGGGYIGRIRFDPADAGRVVGIERLLEGRFGRIRVVAEGPDGGLYFATGNATAEAPGIDILGRLVSGG
jgi:aldose sugar dehydrogenase